MENDLTTQENTHYDLILVGGGLANALIALYLKIHQSKLRVLLLEQSEKLGGNHKWTFHNTDLDVSQYMWLSPLITKSWHFYSVNFPKYSKKVNIGYHFISTEQFHDVLMSELFPNVQLSCSVKTLLQNQVILENGDVFYAPCILDGRGLPKTLGVPESFKKFVGLDCLLEEKHGLENPIIIDVKLPQTEDGFQYFKLLPLTEERILIECTYYSNSNQFNEEDINLKIKNYLQEKGWKIKSIEHKESRVLPIPLSGHWSDVKSPMNLQGTGEIPCSGVRAGLFQPTTGYSFPYAVRFAEEFGTLAPFQSQKVYHFVQALSKKEWKNGLYFRMLNRLILTTTKPEQSYKIFQTFYKQHENLIGKFYSGQLSKANFLKIFLLRSPVSLLRALKILS